VGAEWRDWWLGWRALIAGTAALLAIGLIDRWLEAGPRTLVEMGLGDETAHVLTALILLALLPRRSRDRFLAGALIGAVAIDFDHLPLILGADLLTRETHRPVTHSLLTVIVTVGLAVALPVPWRPIMLGIATGFVMHFWRDLASSTAGVPLLWPWQATGFRLPYDVYLASMLGCVTIATLRGFRVGDHDNGVGR
jgi:inner membrane protein